MADREYVEKLFPLDGYSIDLGRPIDLAIDVNLEGEFRLTVLPSGTIEITPIVRPKPPRRGGVLVGVLRWATGGGTA